MSMGHHAEREASAGSLRAALREYGGSGEGK